MDLLFLYLQKENNIFSMEDLLYLHQVYIIILSYYIFSLSTYVLVLQLGHSKHVSLWIISIFYINLYLKPQNGFDFFTAHWLFAQQKFLTISIRIFQRILLDSELLSIHKNQYSLMQKFHTHLFLKDLD